MNTYYIEYPYSIDLAKPCFVLQVHHVYNIPPIYVVCFVEDHDNMIQYIHNTILSGLYPKIFSVEHCKHLKNGENILISPFSQVYFVIICLD